MLHIQAKTMNRSLASRVREISGQSPNSCMQCGTCSAVCPMFERVSVSPRRVMLASHLGLEPMLGRSGMYEVCLSCQACAVRCPRGIELPAVMDALRQIILRDNIDLLVPEEIPTEQLRQIPQMGLVAAFRKLTA